MQPLLALSLLLVLLLLLLWDRLLLFFLMLLIRWLMGSTHSRAHAATIERGGLLLPSVSLASPPLHHFRKRELRNYKT